MTQGWDDEGWERDEGSWSDADTFVGGNGAAKGRHKERKGGMKLGKPRSSPLGSHHSAAMDSHYVSLPMTDTRDRKIHQRRQSSPRQQNIMEDLKAALNGISNISREAGDVANNLMGPSLAIKFQLGMKIILGFLILTTLWFTFAASTSASTSSTRSSRQVIYANPGVAPSVLRPDPATADSLHQIDHLPVPEHIEPPAAVPKLEVKHMPLAVSGVADQEHHPVLQPQPVHQHGPQEPQPPAWKAGGLAAHEDGNVVDEESEDKVHGEVEHQLVLQPWPVHGHDADEELHQPAVDGGGLAAHEEDNYGAHAESDDTAHEEVEHQPVVQPWPVHGHDADEELHQPAVDGGGLAAHEDGNVVDEESEDKVHGEVEHQPVLQPWPVHSHDADEELHQPDVDGGGLAAHEEGNYGAHAESDDTAREEVEHQPVVQPWPLHGHDADEELHQPAVDGGALAAQEEGNVVDKESEDKVHGDVGLDSMQPLRQKLRPVPELENKTSHNESIETDTEAGNAAEEVDERERPKADAGAARLPQKGSAGVAVAQDGSASPANHEASDKAAAEAAESMDKESKQLLDSEVIEVPNKQPGGKAFAAGALPKMGPKSEANTLSEDEDHAITGTDSQRVMELHEGADVIHDAMVPKSRERSNGKAGPELNAVTTGGTDDVDGLLGGRQQYAGDEIDLLRVGPLDPEESKRAEDLYKSVDILYNDMLPVSNGSAKSNLHNDTLQPGKQQMLNQQKSLASSPEAVQSRQTNDKATATTLLRKQQDDDKALKKADNSKVPDLEVDGSSSEVHQAEAQQHEQNDLLDGEHGHQMMVRRSDRGQEEEEEAGGLPEDEDADKKSFATAEKNPALRANAAATDTGEAATVLQLPEHQNDEDEVVGLPQEDHDENEAHGRKDRLPAAELPIKLFKAKATTPAHEAKSTSRGSKDILPVPLRDHHDDEAAMGGFQEDGKAENEEPAAVTGKKPVLIGAKASTNEEEDDALPMPEHEDNMAEVAGLPEEDHADGKAALQAANSKHHGVSTTDASMHEESTALLPEDRDGGVPTSSAKLFESGNDVRDKPKKLERGKYTNQTKASRQGMEKQGVVNGAGILPEHYQDEAAVKVQSARED